MTELLERTGLAAETVRRKTEAALHGADDGELFVENAVSEAFVLDDGRLKSAATGRSCGFGLRVVAGERTGFAHSSELTEAAIDRAADAARAALRGHEGVMAAPPSRTNRSPYADVDPTEEGAVAEKISLLRMIDDYARALDPRVRQVTASLSSERREVEIWRPDAAPIRDVRPLVRVNVSITTGDGDRQEQGSEGRGGRTLYADFIRDEVWRDMVAEALRQSLVNLEAVGAPAGEMPVVLGPGWPGVLLHEAVGHGLEGDFNRKSQSVYAGRIGERVAAPGVTIVDDGTIDSRRGSIAVDDEGTPAARNVLIEDGYLKGYMQDRLNARLMGVAPTGNGRRESYASTIMPRMTNTFMLGGSHDPEDILSSVEDGLYAVNFGGGQVDIVSGKFVFQCTEAYRIRNGKVAEPVRGATLIGDGPEVLTRISMIGDDMALDRGVGTCGKNGQGVPVGVGQPTLKVDRLTVGGTEAA